MDFSLQCNAMQELTNVEIPTRLNSSMANLNLKYIQVKLNELGQKEMDVMNYLLQSAPGLEILKLKLPEVYEEAQYNWFRQNLSHLKSALDNPCRMIIR